MAGVIMMVLTVGVLLAIAGTPADDLVALLGGFGIIIGPSLWITAFRISSLVVALLLALLQAALWPKTHATSLDVQTGELSHHCFQPVAQLVVVDHLRSNYAVRSPTVKCAELEKFARDLLDQEARHAVRESVSIERWALRRRVSIECIEGNRLVVLTRPRKGETYRAFRPGPEPFVVLPFIETQALCFATLMHMWTKTGYAVTDNIAEKVAEIISQHAPNSATAFALCERYFGSEDKRSAAEVGFSRLLTSIIHGGAGWAVWPAC